MGFFLLVLRIKLIQSFSDGSDCPQLINSMNYMFQKRMENKRSFIVPHLTDVKLQNFMYEEAPDISKNVTEGIQKQSFPDILQKVFLKISQFSQESTCVGVSF